MTLAVDARVLHMFERVVAAIQCATTAFVQGDSDMARQVVADDRHIDALHDEVTGELVRRLTAGYAIDPVEAAAILTALRIVPELERTGDLAELIALRTPQRLTTQLPAPCRTLIADMGGLAASMWIAATDAWARKDGEAAASLRQSDDALDDLHVSLTAELARHDLTVPVAIELGLVARFLERLGDHAVNVTRHLANNLASDDPAL
jgi:phosphate transport system protein